MLKNWIVALLVCLIWFSLVMGGLLTAVELPLAEFEPVILEVGLSAEEQAELERIPPLPRPAPTPRAQEPAEPEPEEQAEPARSLAEGYFAEALDGLDFVLDWRLHLPEEDGDDLRCEVELTPDAEDSALKAFLDALVRQFSGGSCVQELNQALRPQWQPGEPLLTTYVQVYQDGEPRYGFLGSIDDPQTGQKRLAYEDVYAYDWYVISWPVGQEVFAFLQDWQQAPRDSLVTEQQRADFLATRAELLVEIGGLPIFSPADFAGLEQAWGVKIQSATLEQVLAALGSPQYAFASADFIFDVSSVTLGYEFGEFLFHNFQGNFPEPGVQYRLQECTLTGPEVVGPRGIRVGDRLEKVLAQFPRLTDFSHYAEYGPLPERFEVLYVAEESWLYERSGFIEWDEEDAALCYAVFHFSCLDSYEVEDESWWLGEEVFLLCEFVDGILVRMRMGDPACC